MSNKIVKIPHNKISNGKTITQATTTAMEKEGLNIHVNEVVSINDDFKTGERILNVEKKGLMFYGYNIDQNSWDVIFNKKDLRNE